MASFLHAFCFLLISHLVTAQSATQSATPSAIIDTTASDRGILQMVTPTTHANQVALTALASLSGDAFSFYKSYTQIDPFNFQSALVLAVESEPTSAQASLLAGDNKIIGVYLDAYTSLLDNPTSYLSRLHASASPWPSAFSSSLMSQATGILLGYQSLVSQDVLSKSASSGPVTPGMSISVGPAATSASAASSGMGMAASTSSSKAAGVPVVTASPLLMINAAAAAVGMLGVALM